MNRKREFYLSKAKFGHFDVLFWQASQLEMAEGNRSTAVNYDQTKGWRLGSITSS